MESPETRITLDLDANHPNLLRGLEVWLHLGLLTQHQIDQLSRRYLICALPEVVEAQPSLPPSSLTGALERSSPADFVVADVPERRVDRRQPTVSSGNVSDNISDRVSDNVMTRILRSLQQELSVVWLLVLGVFLVVVSSAVLAASQWQNVSPTGQYLVLLGYTLSFWGVSAWASRQLSLRLTTATLKTLTLLLIPVNFWAIDRFLLQTIEVQSVVVAAIASLVLSAIAVLLLKNSSSDHPRFALVYLGLSYLQLGWAVPMIPLGSVYLGSLLFIIAPVLALSRVAVVACAIALLFLRAIFIVDVDIAQLGLAIALCGGGIARIAQRQPGSTAWMFSGAVLLLGWGVSVGAVPWQALVTSGIALLVSYWALQRFWRRSDVALLLTIALQMIWLGWRLVPAVLQTQIITSATQITETESTAIALLGIALFPYLLVILTVSAWLRRQQHSDLATFSEGIALGFGIVLLALSAIAPATRTLNLFASTATLGWLMHRRQSQQQAITSLVYATHLGGLATAISAIHYRFPTLNSSTWAFLFLGGAIAQWIFSTVGAPTLWRRSAWHLGLGLAGLSYVLWVEPIGAAPRLASSWLAVPLALTWMAAQRSQQREMLAGLSALSIVMAQLLTLNRPETGLLGWVVATVLMAVNTGFLQRQLFANLTIGYGLVAVGWGLWHGSPALRSIDQWLLVNAIALVLLGVGARWGQIQLRHRETTRSHLMIALFVQAANCWKAVLIGLVLFGSTVQVWGDYTGGYGVVQPSTALGSDGGVALRLTAIALTTLVLAVQIWRSSSIFVFVGLGLGIELLTAQTLAAWEPSLMRLSIANVGLGLALLFGGDVRQRRAATESLFWGWHGLPLVYGVGAIALRVGTFTAATGWISIGVAAIALGVGRRHRALKPLTVLGVFGTTIGLSELVLYSLRSQSLGNQLIAIAALGLALTLAYRYMLIEKLNYLHLSATEAKSIAHSHWAISSVVLSIAASLTLLVPTPGTLALGGFATGVGLALYAIFQARHHPSAQSAELWLYAGLLEAAALAWYLTTKPWFSGLFAQARPYAGAIAAIAAFISFVLSWERLGWARQPWQRVSIAVPLLVLAATAAVIHPVSLIVLAMFYSLVASLRRQVRWTYLSIVLLNWVAVVQMHRLNVDLLFWQVLPIGLSVLYFATIDPSLKTASARASRHYVRVCGTGLICLTALLTQNNYGIVPSVVSLVAIFAGLGLRIRAFSYVGTIVFCLNVVYQIVVLATTYSLLKWVISLCVGILFIWIAANFETRREQVTLLMRSWLEQLQDWQ
ncbi:hypothetical protein [Myxacorys almedinensis]|uniref:DUF2157 domain-containing protein n=1 Tax=Myxacorys almedinensis A TaxID=2690445 RepID=A0A8J7Z9H8_9CYAN|nr:hypothetical protein [Myxacorys almedinensis]NDJ17895.1 hypothetical protein [Myxacorys almedinensis A]